MAPRHYPIDDSKLAVRYGTVLVLIASTLALQLTVRPLLGEKPYLLFFPSVFFCALLAGFWPGVLATILSSLLAWYFFVPQVSSFTFKPLISSHLFGLSIFACTGLVFSAFSEFARRAYFEARRAIQARDELIAVVSHDLRNPLTGIHLKLQFMSALSKSTPLTHCEFTKQIRPITDAINRMQSLVNSLLDLEKIEAGWFTIEKSECDLQKFIQEIVDMLEPMASQKGISLEYSTDPSASSGFYDRERLLEVLSNLIGNSIKFTPPGGRISLKVRADKGVLEFRVKDSGPGIPEQDLNRVFDRLWQGDGASNGGAGLGLSISKGIVEAHGGKIWANSRVGRGTTFYFAIPHGQEAA
jgi:signal transduction histidine kinase